MTKASDPTPVGAAEILLSEGAHEYRIVLTHADIDYIQKGLLTTGIPYEIDMLRDMAKRLSPGDLVVDAGANIGNHTLYLASVCGCSVVAFEPNLELAEALKSSVALNGLSGRVEVQSLALGASACQAGFARCIPENLGAQSLVLGAGDIQIISLDAFEIKESIRLIKIDVEGMELSVLKGARQTIARDRPILYVECATEESFRELLLLFDELDYVIAGTFNATPTHLFLPRETVAPQAYLPQTKLHEAFNRLKPKGEAVPLRGQLTEANPKFHSAPQNSTELREMNVEANKRTEELNMTAQAQSDTLARMEKSTSQRAVVLEDARSSQDVASPQASARAEEVVAREKGLTKQEATVAALLAEKAELESLLELAEAVHQSMREDLSRGEKKLAQSEASLAALAAEKAKLEGLLNAAVDSQKAASSDTGLTPAQLAEQQATLSQLLREKAELEDRLQAAANLQQTMAEDLQRGAEQLAQQQARIAELVAEKAQLEEQLLASEALRQEAAEELARSEEQITQLHASVARRDDQIANLDATRLGLSAMLDEVRWDAAQVEQKISEIEAGRLLEQERADRAEAECDLLRSKVAQLGSKLRIGQWQLSKGGSTASLSPAMVSSWVNALALPNTAIAERWLELAAELMPIYPDQAKSLLHVVVSLGAEPASSKAARQVGFLMIEEGEARAALALLEPFIDQMNLSSREARLLALARAGEEGDALRVKAERVVRSRLRVATIMDEFTALGYGPECDLQQLSLSDWQNELINFRPEFLLLESAWRGLNGEWGARVGQFSTEVQNILRWCKENSVPTGFWNKEDPVHFETFLNVAQKFDYVFTTDIDCVPRYKAALGHERVHLLPFACQPEIHNPIEHFPRKSAFCFAGAYYVRYPDRTRDLDDMLEHLSEYLPFEIFDRNFGKDHPDYMFPESYQKFIVGTLAPSEIDRAYKGYDFGINLNSVKNSQSMFARRVYELLASNTRIVSNYSPGVRKMFGDLIVSTDSGAEALRRISQQDEQGLTPRLRLAALRKALSEHTYSHRISRIIRLAGLNRPEPSILPTIKVLAKASTQDELIGLLEQFKRQTFELAELVLVTDLDVAAVDLGPRVRVIGSQDARRTLLVDLIGKGEWLAGFVASDYYGPNYLTDLILATRYSSDKAIGKHSYHLLSDGVVELAEGISYAKVESLALRRSILRGDAQLEATLWSWVQALPEAVVEASDLLALDPFNYCENGVGSESLVSETVDDLTELRLGIPGPELEAISDALPPTQTSAVSSDQIISGAALAGNMSPPATGVVSWTVAENGLWNIVSTLENEKHHYIYEAKGRPLAEFSPKGAPFPVHARISVGLNLLFVAVWQDEKRQKIDHQIFNANQNVMLKPPAGTAFVVFGVRPRGPGSCSVQGLQLTPYSAPPCEVIGGGGVLLLTNHYPSYQDLYRNGFIHSRVRAYRELGGLTPDIYRLRPGQALTWHEFQDVDCMTGSAEQLDYLLESGRYSHVLVHFLEPTMWQVLARHIDKVAVTVWLHGAEVQPWWRRSFNYTSEAELEKAKVISADRLKFWRSLFDPLPENLHFVFVSKSFADQVFEDLEVVCPPEQYSIIHNPIDTALFAYNEKPVEQRGKILSIRPFASRVYANDQTVAAILALRRRDFFDQLHFRIIGDGPLFEEVTAPLAGLPNVVVEKRFLLQQEVAALHQEYGVFLAPSRMDTQGVSRDEAMSSGLVPVTSRIAAIPEFVDAASGYLAEPEDAEGLSRAIMEIWKNPEIFASKSKAAAERVRAQRDKQSIIDLELSLILKRLG